MATMNEEIEALEREGEYLRGQLTGTLRISAELLKELPSAEYWPALRKVEKQLEEIQRQRSDVNDRLKEALR